MSLEDLLTILFALLVCGTGPLFFCISIALGVAYFRGVQRTRTLGDLVQRLKQNATQVSCDEWLKGVTHINYRNEIEVEMKFIYPLIRFLGYDSGAFQIRVPVKVKVGRKETKVEADWVIWSTATTGGKRQALIVVEAKGPGQALDGAVQAQARSYAFGLNAPTYVLTNGRRLQVFRRGVQSDTCVVDCGVNDLVNTWAEVEYAIGANAHMSERQGVNGAA